MVKITIHALGEGECCLSGKNVKDGLLVSFDDKTLSESLLSTKSFLQLVRLKLGVKNSNTKQQTETEEVTPMATPLNNETDD